MSTLFFFFFNDTATTEIYTLSLHDALPILRNANARRIWAGIIRRNASPGRFACPGPKNRGRDRKSTRLNSSHSQISYAVFCLKKKTIETIDSEPRLDLTPSVEQALPCWHRR